MASYANIRLKDVVFWAVVVLIVAPVLLQVATLFPTLLLGAIGSVLPIPDPVLLTLSWIIVLAAIASVLRIIWIMWRGWRVS